MRGLRLPQRLSEKDDSDGGMDNPVHHRVGDGLLPDRIVPHLHRDLRGDDGRSLVVPVVDDVHQQAPGHVVEGTQCEVVQDQQVRPLDPLEIAEDLPGGLRRLERPHQPGRAGVDDPQVLLAGAIPEGGGDVGLTRSRAAGDEDVLPLLDEGKVGEPLYQVLVKPPFHGVVDFLDGRREPEARGLDQMKDVPVEALVPFVADKHVHELVDGHVVATVVLQARLEGVVHPEELQLLHLVQGVPVHLDFHGGFAL